MFHMKQKRIGGNKMNKYQKGINKVAKWTYWYNLEKEYEISFYKIRKWIRKTVSKKNIKYY